MPTATDLEMKFYGDLGYTGSLTDRRRAYWIAVDTLNPSMTFNETAKAFWANNAVEVATWNAIDLERRYYLGGAIKFTAANSVSDLRYEKFGGNP